MISEQRNFTNIISSSQPFSKVHNDTCSTSPKWCSVVWDPDLYRNLFTDNKNLYVLGNIHLYATSWWASPPNSDQLNVCNKGSGSLR